MSQIDLKYATITIRDGYAGPAGPAFTVNNVAGYPIGTTTMLIGDGTTILATGDSFTVAGDTVNHKITAHTETATATTSITFTPALAAAVIDEAEITILPHMLEVNISEGNITFSEKRNMQYKLNRGRLDVVREGDEAPMEIKMDFLWDFLRSVTGATTPTVEEAFKQIGAASTWISSDPDVCQPYAVDIVIDYVPPCTTEAREVITLNDFRWEDLSHDPKQGQVAVTGKCNVTQADIIRIAQV